MSGCFVGKMPGFEDSNLFSETPIIAILETEGAVEEFADGSRSINGGKFKIVSFENISDARKFRKEHENPDTAPTTVKIYGFSSGEWRHVKAIAEWKGME